MRRYMVAPFGFAAVAAYSAIAAAGALAAGNGPTSAVYTSPGTKIQIAITPHVTVPTPSTTLPFTGLDLGLICLAGLLLIVVGFALHRVARRSPRI